MAKTLPGRFAAGLSLERQWRKGQGGAKTRSPNYWKLANHSANTGPQNLRDARLSLNR